jgi:DNA-binding transcriptional LysR family regulator
LPIFLAAAQRVDGSSRLTELSEFAVTPDIAAGRLIRVLEDWTPPYPGLCLYYPGHRHVPAGLRAFIEVIRAASPRQSSDRKRAPRMPVVKVAPRRASIKK